MGPSQIALESRMMRESVVGIVEPFVLEELEYVCLHFLDDNRFLLSMIPFRNSCDARFGSAYRR